MRWQEIGWLTVFMKSNKCTTSFANCRKRVPVESRGKPVQCGTNLAFKRIRNDDVSLLGVEDAPLTSLQVSYVSSVGSNNIIEKFLGTRNRFLIAWYVQTYAFWLGAIDGLCVRTLVRKHRRSRERRMLESNNSYNDSIWKHAVCRQAPTLLQQLPSIIALKALAAYHEVVLRC